MVKSFGVLPRIRGDCSISIVPTYVYCKSLNFEYFFDSSGRVATMNR